MATYKVPQDVEADDKLLGPFSFRQFIYLIVTAMLGLLAWGLAQLFIGLVIIPVPFMLLFGALALPLRKDQPMEIYLAAIVSYYLKPHLRIWDPEGIEETIEISAPKNTEENRVKDLSQTEALKRLDYLANIVDSKGWSIRGTSDPTGTSMNNDVFLEAQGAEDVLDTNTSIARGFDQMMNDRTAKMREEARERMIQATVVQAPPQQQQFPQQSQPPQPQPLPSPQPQSSLATPVIQPHYDPYPTIHQSVIQPIDDVAHLAGVSDIPPPAQPTLPYQPTVTPMTPEEKVPTTSDIELSTGIINLANNASDLSIETIAKQAHRLEDKVKKESNEVVIKLR